MRELGGLSQHPCRVASRNFVTGCLMSEVTRSSRIDSCSRYHCKAVGESVAAGGRRPSDEEAESLSDSRGDICSRVPHVADHPLHRLPTPRPHALL